MNRPWSPLFSVAAKFPSRNFIFTQLLRFVIVCLVRNIFRLAQRDCREFNLSLLHPRVVFLTEQRCHSPLRCKKYIAAHRTRNFKWYINVYKKTNVLENIGKYAEGKLRWTSSPSRSVVNKISLVAISCTRRDNSIKLKMDGDVRDVHHEFYWIAPNRLWAWLKFIFIPKT